MEENWKKEVKKGGCETLENALHDCHRRIPAGIARESACRHLNRAFADCLVRIICPSELDAVQSLCSSGGTSLKRSQCQQARLSLSVCLSQHQFHD
ncbi:Methionine--tRNA ligase cytoplasmic [Bienertia sinuspersici]